MLNEILAQTTENKTPTEIYETVVYNFVIVTAHTETPTGIEFFATTKNAAEINARLGQLFACMPAEHHTRFADKLQFWGWEISEIAENLGV